MRRRAERPNDVWPYDFVFERTAAGRALKLLVVVAAYTRACLAIVVARRLPSIEVLACLAERFVRRAVLAHIRSDNGPEFAAKAVRHWLERVGVQTLFIEPGSPWENGSVESLNGKLRDECLNRERFDTLLEAQILSEQWRFAYNHLGPHSSLRYRPPAPSARPALRQSQLPLEIPVLSSEVLQRLGARQATSAAQPPQRHRAFERFNPPPCT